MSDKALAAKLSEHAVDQSKKDHVKKVKESVGKETQDEHGDAHMIASNDLMVRMATCQTCNEKKPLDVDHWPLTYFKHEFMGSNQVPKDEKPKCRQCKEGGGSASSVIVWQ